MGDDHEWIRDRAYQLWELAGRPEGRSLDFWFAALRERESDSPSSLPSHHIVEQGVLDEEPEALTMPSEIRSPLD